MRLWEHSVNMIIQRIFGTPVPAPSASTENGTRLSIEQIRHSLHGALHDCQDMRTQRVIYKINMAQTPAELWLLRSDLHQCIARVHSQAIAAERINSLLSVFAGWLPSKQLAPI